jgi:hypothetical protein
MNTVLPVLCSVKGGGTLRREGLTTNFSFSSVRIVQDSGRMSAGLVSMKAMDMKGRILGFFPPGREREAELVYTVHSVHPPPFSPRGNENPPESISAVRHARDLRGWI